MATDEGESFMRTDDESFLATDDAESYVKTDDENLKTDEELDAELYDKDPKVCMGLKKKNISRSSVSEKKMCTLCFSQYSVWKKQGYIIDIIVLLKMTSIPMVYSLLNSLPLECV